MIDNNVGRTWGNAPSSVRQARRLAWLGAILTGYACLMLFGIFQDSTLQEYSRFIIMTLLFAMMFPVYIWMLFGLKRGIKAAYYVQMIVALVGLIGFPIATLINAYILYKWFRPETRAWFGV